jgi:hypothetical protein
MSAVAPTKPPAVAIRSGLESRVAALRDEAIRESIFDPKRGSEDHSLGGSQNPADAPWLQNRRVTILRHEKV